MSVRLMIADDHAAVRVGVISLIRGTEIELICQAETCSRPSSLLSFLKPDVLLLDVRLAGSDGLSALEQIHRENPAHCGFDLLCRRGLQGNGACP